MHSAGRAKAAFISGRENSFGEGHGFFAGWCYWLSNVVYLPTVLLSCVGVGLYVFGASAQSLASSERLTGGVALMLLLGLLVLNVRGQQLGKWMTNVGGVGTVGGGILVCMLGAWTLHSQGSAVQLHDLNLHGASWRLIAVFGTICYSLQGLDLASIMGDEIREPRRILPGAIFWGGVISGAIYLGVTFSMLIALPHEQIGVLSGVLQAVSTMADRAHLRMVVAPLALFEFIAILGTASAWFSGSARLPFVAGIDRYLPPALGRVHPKFHTPYVALGLFAVLSAMLIMMSYAGRVRRRGVPHSTKYRRNPADGAQSLYVCRALEKRWPLHRRYTSTWISVRKRSIRIDSIDCRLVSGVCADSRGQVPMGL